ncbi:MAG TPA: hypothetical protein VES88_05200 [Gemmatimonadaceae bacterium]|nr:hypothetical protein [Gemmatimonadaceae bacterium]
MTAGALEMPDDRRKHRVRRFLAKCFLLGVAIVGSGFLISRYDTRASDDNYLAAVLEKDRLIRTAPSPKIILVGGSNLAFGIDSRMMRDSLNVNVVNMGLYARLGLRYMLAQVKPYIRPGDVVVISPEYDQFYGKFSEGDNTLNTALLYAPADRIGDFIKSYSVIDIVLRPRVENARRGFLQAVADLFGVKDKYFPPDTNPVYNRRSFNQFGDMMSHLGRKSMNPDSIYVSQLPPRTEFNKRTLDDLNDIGDAARARQAHAYFLFPSYIDRSYTVNTEAIDGIRRRLANDMRIPILGTPKDFVYPASWFFDTRYHLNELGRGPRTLKMIEILREVRVRGRW